MLKTLLRFLPVLLIWISASVAAQSTVPTGDGAQGTVLIIDQVETIANLEADLSELTQMFAELDRRYADLKAREDAGLLAASQALNQAKIDHLTYENSLRAHVLRILTWQLFSSYLVLALVIGVTGLGIYLSFKEVMSAVQAPDKVVDVLKTANFAPTAGGDADGYADGTPGQIPATGGSLILSAQKLQVTSAVTGVVILVLSLAFLYLFVREVLEVVPRNFSSDLAPGAAQTADPGDGG